MSLQKIRFINGGTKDKGQNYPEGAIRMVPSEVADEDALFYISKGWAQDEDGVIASGPFVPGASPIDIDSVAVQP